MFERSTLSIWTSSLFLGDPTDFIFFSYRRSLEWPSQNRCVYLVSWIPWKFSWRRTGYLWIPLWNNHIFQYIYWDITGIRSATQRDNWTNIALIWMIQVLEYANNVRCFKQMKVKKYNPSCRININYLNKNVSMVMDSLHVSEKDVMKNIIIFQGWVLLSPGVGVNMSVYILKTCTG